MRAECLKMKILYLNNIRSGGQRFGFKSRTCHSQGRYTQTNTSMKKTFALIFLFFCINPYLKSQEFKVDTRLQFEREDPLNIYENEKMTPLDILQAMEVLGIQIHKFDLGKFDGEYDIQLLSEKYKDGKLLKTDTIAQFESIYRYYESSDQEAPYYDYMNQIKLITKDSANKSRIHIKTLPMSTYADIELDKANEYSFFIWRRYKNTEWKLEKKIPLMIYASSWRDEKYGYERFCGVATLSENEKYTNELLDFSPNYVMITYRATKKK